MKKDEVFMVTRCGQRNNSEDHFNVVEIIDMTN